MVALKYLPAQFIGTWVSGVREVTGKFMFQSYKFQGSFSNDQVHIMIVYDDKY